MTEDENAHCAALLRRGDRDRWLTALFAPTDARGALMAVAAFNLELALVRERIREPHMALLRLQWWRDGLAATTSGASTAHPVMRALAAPLAADPGLAIPLAGIIDAREADIEEMPFADPAELHAYAAASAGNVNVASLRILAPGADAAAEHVARTLGTAWALVGLLRAAPHLAAQRRCPLPAIALARVGVDPEAWFSGRAGSMARDVVRETAQTAEALFAGVVRAALPRAAFALGAQRTLGRWHLARLAQFDHDVFAPSWRGPTPSDAARLALAWLLHRW
jgi:NADH dehydrogenase [ubiquinone] 1 alpha subcomplex assembly factor 6